MVKPEYAVISYGWTTPTIIAGETHYQRLSMWGTVYGNGKERLHRPHHRRLDIQLQHLPGAHRRRRGCLRRFRRIDVSLKRWYHVFNKPCLAGFECLQARLFCTEKSGSAHYDAAKRGSAALSPDLSLAASYRTRFVPPPGAALPHSTNVLQNMENL